MIRMLALIKIAIITALASASVQAACGGGGFKPSNQQTEYRQTPATTTVVSANYRSDNSQQYRTQQPVQNSRFDTQRFNRISGRLSLSQSQANDVIHAMNDVRTLEGTSGKDFEPQKEFDKRLMKILNDQQLVTYKSLN